MKQFIFMLTFIISSAQSVGADITSDAVSLMEEVKAQGECSSYIGFLYNDYTIAGFKGKADAMRANNRHIEKAATAAQKFVTLSSQNDIDGKRFIYKKAGKSCVGEICLPSLDFIASMFLIGGMNDGQKEVSEQEISCPSNVWAPCYGREPVDNRAYKASNLYKSKNCRLLLR